MKAKLLYKAPTSKIIEVRFEGSILQGSDPTPGAPGANENIDDQGDC